MKPGKLAAQSAHASLHAALKADKRVLDTWLKEGAIFLSPLLPNDAGPAFLRKSTTPRAFLIFWSLSIIQKFKRIEVLLHQLFKILLSEVL